jgi:hypothetical protein
MVCPHSKFNVCRMMQNATSLEETTKLDIMSRFAGSLHAKKIVFHDPRIPLNHTIKLTLFVLAIIDFSIRYLPKGIFHTVINFSKSN